MDQTQLYVLLPALRPWIAGGALAFAVYALIQALPKGSRKSNKRLQHFAGVDEASKVEVGSTAHRIRLAFLSFGLDVSGNEDAALWSARLGAVGLVTVIGTAFSLPLFIALALGGAGWIVVDSVIQARWQEMVVKIEKDVPTFLLRLAGTVQVETNVLNAISEVAETFDPKSPLRSWLERFLAQCQSRGQAGLQAMLVEATAISSALGLAVFEIGRLWETGGEGYTRSFAVAADNLSNILQARGMANAKGDGARGAIRIVVLSLAAVMIFLIRTPQFGPVIKEPIMQLAYAAIIAWVAYGWKFINTMIDEAI